MSDANNNLPLFEKKTVPDLTLFSRESPLFSSFIPVGRPNMGDHNAFMKHMEQMWESRLLANRGPLVLEFERELSTFLGVRNFVTMCNGTVALEIAARALGMSGEVIVPSYTFIATAHCLQWQEITPVFCDVDPVTHTLDVSKIEALITPRTSGIIAVHLWGQPCDTEALQNIADRHKIKLMYDAAHAMGCSHNGINVGNFGNCEIFSFHATKFFNSFEGGGVATNDDSLAENIRRTVLTRDEIVALLTCENLSARRYFYPGCHRMEPYKSFFPHAGLLLPVTNAICASVICLPTGTGISLSQIRQVGALLRFLLTNAAEIKKRIAELPFPLPIAPGELPPKT